MRIYPDLAALGEAEGEVLGPTDWVEVDQARIDAFADVTGDHQWIHVDPVRAADGPFGATIAHGYLTLSLLAELTQHLLRVDGASLALNYGLERVRFLAPVRAGSRIRGKAEVASVTPTDGGVRLVLDLAVELEGADRPALAASSIALFRP